MNILFVNSTVRTNSRTYVLANHLLNNLKQKYPNCTINTVNLEKENIQSLNSSSLALRDQLIKNKEYDHPMFKYARDFNQADVVVIATPFWDLAFPANLKNYLEHIAIQGINFEYIHGIPKALCNIQKLFYVSTSGGPISTDFGFNYVKTLAELFYGIKENVFFKAELLDITNAKVEEILENTKHEIDKYFQEKEV